MSGLETHTHTTVTEGCDTDGNLVRDCEKSVRNHGNQSEITEIWLEIRNQGLENPVEIRKSARNHEKSEEKSGEITRNTPFCLSMRSRPFAHAHLRYPREIRVTKAGNHLEINWKSVGNHSEGRNQLKSGNLVRREGPCHTPRL